MSDETSKEIQTMNMRTTVPHASRWRRLTLLGALLAIGTWLLPAAPGRAAEPAPAWSIIALPYPTNFAPASKGTVNTGPGYLVLARNVGRAATSGTFKVSTLLPAGVTPASGFVGKDWRGRKLTCVTAGQAVTCTGSAPLLLGETAQLQIPVSVAEALPESVTAEATVEGGGAAPVATTVPTTISPSVAPFDFLRGTAGLFALATNGDGSSATQAGSHPYQLTVGMHFPLVPPPKGSPTFIGSGGGVKDIVADLPRGTVVNPRATPVRCTDLQLATNTCPDASQIGTVANTISLLGITSGNQPLYNMVPAPGVAGEFAFSVISGLFVHLQGRVRSDDDYGLSSDTTDILTKVGIGGTQVTFWGNPSDESHDPMRKECIDLKGDLEPGELSNCQTERLDTALLTLPSQCTGPITTAVRAAPWLEPTAFSEASTESQDTSGTPVGIDGCNQLEFKPTIEAQPTTNLADSPSGLNFNLHQPQNLDFESLSPANLKDTTVTLPEGMTVNPSSADGLGACSTSEVGLTTVIGAEPIRFTADPANCPNASKLGSVQVTTPLLEDPLPGAVYLAEPYQNPFNSLLAIYLTIHDEERGVVAKLAGKVTPDPSTGQLSARFEENPELPIEDVKVNFFGDPRGSLRTPPTCATYTTQADLTPWSAPEGPDAHPTDSFAISANPGGGACPTTEAQAPHAPSFTAGTVDPVAGAYSPFLLRVNRNDASQELSAIDATLPPGLSAKLAGVPYCPESSIAEAKARERPNQGALELANPSCPASSQVGSVDVAAGAGITPLHVGGKAYLAGPYKGAPLSLVVITPAVAGPFDLGAVVVRSALRVDPKSAQVRALSDPLPTIIEGIPLDVRSVTVKADKPRFSLNPTSCDPMAVLGSATSVLNQSAALSNPFQVGGCKALPFKPRLFIKLKGKTRRGGHPSLTAVATFKQGHANTKKAAVTLPKSAFLDQSHIRTVCTRVQFAAESCPKGSIYGFARAFTPLLDQPLRGPVYLRSSDNELPDLVADLRGQVRVELVGRVDSVGKGIRNTFEAAPDAPVSRFVLRMQGGPKGLLINSENLCRASKAKRRATVKMDAHNGKVRDFRPLVKNSCGKKGRKGRRGGKHQRR